MIVPRYWSESKVKTTFNGRQFTIKRFGWSDVSEDDARAHADSRLDEALKTLQATGDVRRIDHKVSYNGADGVPIREEVVATHDDVVISRNSYGALCLNTPDVMFADIDFDYKPPKNLVFGVFALFMLVSGIASLILSARAVLVGGFIAWVIFSGAVVRLIDDRVVGRKGKIEDQALARFKSVVSQNKHLHLRVYRTTMGFRILFMEGTHDPVSEATLKLLKSLESDSLYIQMCRNQHCFRARVSPKPWRIGVERLRPRPGVWPINPERLKERQVWVAGYDQKAKDYSTCRFVMKLGSDIVHDKAERVRRLHDELCRVSAAGDEVV